MRNERVRARSVKLARLRFPALAFALIAAALVAAPAASARSTPAEVADGLRRDPVYVDREAKPRISQRDAGRIRLRIVRKNIGRIKVAVIPASDAERLGGVGNFAHAVDQRLVNRGALLVAAGPGIHIVVSHRGDRQAVGAVQAAVNAHEGDRLAVKLLDAVDRLAEVDPGPDADLNKPAADSGGTVPSAPGIDATGAVDDVVDTFKLVFYIVLAMIAAPFLIGGFLLWRRARRGQAEAAEVLADDRQAARDELVALGDEIRALDLDVSMPNADAKGKAEYELALADYERADRFLARAAKRRHLAAATAALAAGRRHMEAAKARFSGSTGAKPG